MSLEGGKTQAQAGVAAACVGTMEEVAETEQHVGGTMNKTRLYELVQVVTVLVRANGTKVECLVFVRIGGWLLGCLWR